MPVRPTMMRTNPAAPTLTFTVCPINRIRSHAVPASYSEPNNCRICAGAIRNSSSSGTVSASVQRVTDLNRPFSRSCSPRSCRSATNGLNM